MSPAPLGWFGVIKLGLVQTALGAVVILTTSTLNRIMVVELQLAAVLPGLLVALHYAVQVTRPRWGYGSDVGGRRTPWIVGGMAVLSLGGFLAAIATVWMASHLAAAIALAALAFVMIGIGVGAAGTSLLVLLAKRVAPPRRAAAATIVWVMMLAGFIVTAGVGGHFLDPFSPGRLLAVAGAVSASAFIVTLLAVWGMEGPAEPAVRTEDAAAEPKPPFMRALAQIWTEPEARNFTIFIFVSMLAYSAQDLILEPFAGTIFGFTPGASTKLAGVQHSGVLVGMVLIGFLASAVGGRWLGSLRSWTIIGCVLSGLALFALAFGGHAAPHWPLSATVFLLGFANGVFAVAAIGSMMALAGKGRGRREGVRMGLWGAAQAIGFGLGGFLGAASVDLMRALSGDPLTAYSSVFAVEACLFVAAAFFAARIGDRSGAPRIGAIGENMLPAGVGDRS